MNQIAYQPAADDTFPPIPTSYLDAYIIYTAKDVHNIPGNDLRVCAHPNGITFIALASSHAALADAAEPALTNPPEDLQAAQARVDFDIKGKSLLNVEFRKGRGPIIHPGQPLCRLTCTSGSDQGSGDAKGYLLECPVRGLLVEVNKKLTGLSGRELLSAMHDDYIAIVDMKASEIEKLKAQVAENAEK